MRRLLLFLLVLAPLPAADAQDRPTPPGPTERTERYTYDPTTGTPTLTVEAAAAFFEHHAERRAAARTEAEQVAASGAVDGSRTAAPPASRGGGLFTVNTAFDTGDTNPGDGSCIASGFLNGCTLRAAIEEANATPGADPVSIEFDIVLGPAGSDLGFGRWRIRPGSTLPLITRENVTLNATTQSNAVCGILTAGGPFAVPHDLKIVLDGSLLAGSGSGLSASSLAADIDIRGFVVQNFPGYGIVTGGAGSEVACNYVGTSTNGTGAAPNADGILVGGFFVSPGAVTVENNLVSGNDGDGLFVSRNLAEVQDNLVGTTSSGTNPLGNGGAGLFGDGIFVSGDDVTVDGNVASANNGNGIVLGSSDGFLGGMIHAERAIVTNNTVGLTRRGLRNGIGNSVLGIFVGLFEPSDNDVGLPGGGNLVGDNGGDGVFVRGIGNRVRGNVVGLDANAVPAPNQTGVRIGGTGNVVQNNTISGNAGDGIYFGTWDAVIEDNRIGTDAAVTTTRPNGGAGIHIDRADGATINGNTIGGNLREGIYLVSSSNVTAEGNLIGTNTTRSFDLGNGLDGIDCFDATDVHLGQHGNANVIGYNGGDGIRIGDSCQDISLINNATFSNGGLGVDLGGDGVTPNDPGDGDGGANGLQNYPVITSATNDGTDAVVAFTLDSLPNRSFELLFCHVPTPDASGYGECDDPDLIEMVTTNGSGNAVGTVTAPASEFPVGHWVAATATVAIGALPQGYGPTSELSQAVRVQAVTPPGVFLSATNTSPLTVAPGGQVSFDYTVQNTTASPATGDLFYTVSPGGLSAVIASGTVPAGQTANGSFVQNVPPSAPAGSYTYTLRIGQFPNTTVDSEAFTVTVTGSARPGEGAGVWTVTEASAWVLTESDDETAEATSRDETVPDKATLMGSYPNPFSGQATVALTLPEATTVRLAVYDVLGREVAALMGGDLEAGRHEAVLDGRGLPAGVYLVRLEAGGTVQTQRVTLIR